MKNKGHDYFILKPTCWICGKVFDVKISTKTGKIISKCFHSTIRNDIFMGWTYSVEEWAIGKPHFKSLWYKVIGFTRPQRWVVYKIWNLFHRKRQSYWECLTCSSKPNN